MHLFALAVIFASVLGSAGPNPNMSGVLRTVDEIEEFFQDSTVRRQGCQLRGVLQRHEYANPKWLLTIKDDSGRRAEFLSPADWHPTNGYEVVLNGFAAISPSRERYLTATNIAIIGQKPVDTPLTIPLGELDGHTHDLCDVIVTGTVVDAYDDEIDPSYGVLILKSDDAMLPVSYHRPPVRLPCSPQSLIDATITVKGVYHRIVSGERKFNGAFIEIDESSPPVIRDPPPADPFAAPPLNASFYQSPKEILRLGRRTTSGKVLAVWQDDRFLLQQDDSHLITVELRGDDVRLPAVGSRVTAVGYPDTDRFRLILTRALFRTEPHSEPLDDDAEPINANAVLKAVGGHEVINVRYHGKLVSLYGMLTSVPPTKSPSRRAFVNSKGYTVPIELAGVADEMEKIEIGSYICVTGRCLIEIEPTTAFNAYPRVCGFFIVPRRPEDIKVLATPPWWTPLKLLMVIGVLSAVILVLFVRNRIQRHFGQLKVTERTRLSIELHDTLSQNLTGASLEVTTAEQLAKTDTNAALAHLSIASSTLKSCRNELRNCLWDLRSQALEETDLNEAIRRTLEPYVGGTELTVRFNVPRERLTDETAHALMRIVRELVLNAIRHGRASHVWIAGATEGDLILLSVRDNGCGFVPERAPGLAQGHFGLQGIRERIKRYGGTVEIESSPNAGTKVSIRFTLPMDNTELTP